MLVSFVLYSLIGDEPLMSIINLLNNRMLLKVSLVSLIYNQKYDLISILAIKLYQNVEKNVFFLKYVEKSDRFCQNIDFSI